MSRFENDLTKGSVWRQLLIFSLPLFAGNLLQSCFNLADMIILGRFGGTASLSGVSLGGGVMTILSTFAAGLATGGTVVIGNYLGSGRKEKINRVISTLLVTLTSFGLAFMTCLLLFSNQLLKLMRTPIESFHQAREYLLVCAIGLVFIYGYNALGAIMRGLGDSATPTYFLVVACGVNIGLDFLLVAYYDLGAMGAALATVISQAGAMFAMIIYLKMKKFMFDFKPSSFIFYKQEFKSILKTGLPMSIQSIATNLSFLVLSSFNNQLGGVNASAAVAVVMNFNGFAILPSHALNAAATAMISQNAGKGDLKRSRQTVNVCLILCIIVSAIVFILVRLFPTPIFNLFGAEKAVITCGIPYLLAFSFEYVGLPFIVGYNSFQTGTGRGWVILITTLCSSFIFRIPMAMLFGFYFNMGIEGVAYGIPIATAFGAFMSWVFYMVFRNKQIAKI